MTNEITTAHTSSMPAYFRDMQAFENIQRIAKMFAESTLVPQHFQKNVGNCVIALEMSERMNANPIMVMQNLYIVHGRPGWSSTFIISAINSCGRFRPLRFDVTGAENTDDRSCVAWTVESNIALPEDVRTLSDAKRRNLPILEGPKVSIKMAKEEGWHGKTGSKWKTMPDVMLNYRAASFFGKLYAPEILMGMQTREETEDMINVTPKDNSILKAAFMAGANNADADVIIDVKTKNKMDDILSKEPIKSPVSNVDAKISPDDSEQIDLLQDELLDAVADSFSPMHRKADEIISALNSTTNKKELDAIWKDNVNHLEVMDNDLKNLIWATRDERLKTFGK